MCLNALDHLNESYIQEENYNEWETAKELQCEAALI